MNREFVLNLLFLLCINLLVKPLFIFGIDLQVQNRVGQDYGLYFALLNLSYIFQIFNDFGLQNFNNRHISRYPHLLPKYLPNLLAIKVLLSLLYVVLCIIAAFFARYDGRALCILLILLINQVLIQFIFFMRSNISGLGHYRLDSLLSSLDKLLMLFTCGALVWFAPQALRIETFALAQMVALLLTLGLAYVALRGKAEFSLRPSWASNWRSGYPTIVVLFKKSLPFALVIFLMYAYTRIDGVLLERMAGPAHAEVYAGAYRLLDACNMFGYLFATLLLPMFARLDKQGESPRPLVSLSFKLIWAGSITLAAAIFFARADLVQLMFPDTADPYRWQTLGLLIWAFVPVCSTYIFSTLLTAHERLGAMNRFFLIGIAMDVLLNLWLVPTHAARGSAIATLCTQSFVAGAMIWLCLRHYDLKPSPIGLLRIVGFAAFVLMLDWLVFEKTALSWWLKFALAFLSGAIGLLGLLDWRMVMAGLRNRL